MEFRGGNDRWRCKQNLKVNTKYNKGFEPTLPDQNIQSKHASGDTDFWRRFYYTILMIEDTIIIFFNVK